MEIKFLGTGGAFDFEKGTAAATITVRDTTILIDCGYSTLLRLGKLPITESIDYILLTHLHADHVGSLPTLLPYYKYVLQRDIPKILVPNETFQQEIHQFLTSTYEEKNVHYESLQTFSQIGYLDTSNQHVPGLTSFAYYFTDEDHLIYYSGDISTAQTAHDFLATRNETNITVFHEATFAPDIPVHTHYREIPDKLGAYDVYLYHVAKEHKPSDCKLPLVEEVPTYVW